MSPHLIPGVLLLLWASTLPAQANKHTETGTPREFDYYVLTLSWSPQYCGSRSNADPSQCGEGRKFGFIVHGLWPQYERGYPRNCGPRTPVAPAVIDQMLPIMPSRKLIQHEWNSHGICSGDDDARYFENTRKLFARISVPREFHQPLANITVSPDEIKRNFLLSNRSLEQDGIRVTCSGRFLSEVRLCYTKDLQPRACGADLKDTCRSGEVIMQPVR